MPKPSSTAQQDRLAAATAGLTANRSTFYYAMLLSLSGSVSDADWDKALTFAGGLWGQQASSTSTGVPPDATPATSGLSKDKGAK